MSQPYHQHTYHPAVISLRRRRTGDALVFFALISLWLCAACGGRQDGPRNQLASADSPYLRAHADNPVNWHLWGADALEKARLENKPLLISVGYASCHWCHVMEEESFMDTAVARVMNENFIPVKVDREQRPDIDRLYLEAAQLITGSSGWPLHAFALPDGRPFYAGTYYPRDQWLSLLRQVSTAYARDSALVVRQAEDITKGVIEHDVITTPVDDRVNISREMYAGAFDQWLPLLDVARGGLRGAPKFPMPGNWQFLLDHHVLTGDTNSLGFATLTLDHLAQGGIYDHVGGGFFRYATDEEWRVPHFEKMLYDNAQLISLYARAYRVTRKPMYRRIMEETAAFVVSELASPEGGFYSSLNADSEGEEGKFYVWSTAEMNELFGAEMAPVLASYYHMKDSGNWEGGKNIPFTSGTVPEDNGYTADEWSAVLAKAREKLRSARSRRVRPSTDEKILTSWNALMLTALTDVYVVTKEPRYLKLALENGLFLESRMMREGGGLWRNYHDGGVSIDGFLEDYAFLAQAFINLYQVTFDKRWIEDAKALAGYTQEHFYDPRSGMFFYTSDRADDVIARKMELSDHVLPASNSVLASVLFQLGELYQDSVLTSLSDVMVRQVMDRAEGESLFYANWLRQAGWFSYGAVEVAVVGDSSRQAALALQERYHPLAIYLGGQREDLPLLSDKLLPGKTMIYVCRNRTCRLPVTEVSRAIGQIHGSEP